MELGFDQSTLTTVRPMLPPNRINRNNAWNLVGIMPALPADPSLRCSLCLTPNSGASRKFFLSLEMKGGAGIDQYDCVLSLMQTRCLI